MSEIKERATAAQHEPDETDTVPISLDYIKRSMDGFGLSMRHAQWLIAEVERANMWKNAVIDACVVSWVMKKEHEHDPKLAVNDLCAWCHSVALDPKVSSEAKALYDRITDLLAELERVDQIAAPIVNGDVTAEITRLNQRIAELEDSLKKVQNIAKSAMDQLPGRWNMGFQAGLKKAIPYEKELTDALASERQGRKDDNAALTEDILRLEAENARLTQHVVELERQVLHDGIAANRRIKRLVDRINELEAT